MVSQTVYHSWVMSIHKNRLTYLSRNSNLQIKLPETFKNFELTNVIIRLNE